MKKSMISKVSKEFKSIGALICMSLFLSACSDDSGEPSVPPTPTNSVAPAPAEPLVFKHDSDGSLNVGEAETIQLSFIEQYDAGVISITVSDVDGLSFHSLTAQSFSLETATEMPMDLVVNAEKAGNYTVAVTVDTNDGEGKRETRTFSLQLSAS